MNFFKNNYNKMLIVGIFMTSLLFLKLITCLPPVFLTIIDVCAMLGSGIFCSALVSLVIDIDNKKAASKSKESQRNFILNPIRHSLFTLYRHELIELSAYHTKYILNENGRWVKGNLTLKELGEKNVSLINQIQQFENTCTHIDVAYIERQNNKFPHLAQKTRYCYENLQRVLQHIVDEYNTYFINDLFKEDEFDILRGLAWEIRDILIATDEDFFDPSVLDNKLFFFERTDELISFFELADEPVFLHYRSV